MTGDDGYDLIQAYSKLFNVDISGFHYQRYFYPEPGWFTHYKKIIPLTVRDLMNGIKAGKLT